MGEQERKEMEQMRIDRERLKSERKHADRDEAVRVAAVRRERMEIDRMRRGSEGNNGGRDFPLLSNAPLTDSVVSFDHVRQLITTLRNDPSVTPIPEDFASPDAFHSWRQTMNMSLQKVVVRLLKLRFLKPQDSAAKTNQPATVKLHFNIAQARGLIAKEGRTRDPYCKVEFGDLDRATGGRNQPEIERFETGVKRDTTEPVWNEHVELEVKNLTDKVSIEVWDRIKEQFLGKARIDVSDLVTQSARRGHVSNWIRLEPRDNRGKD
eukprot:jgi/Hompol1/4222/HPOL_006990-RA